MSKKKIIDVELREIEYDTYGDKFPIDEVIKAFVEMKELGATHVEFNAPSWEGDAGTVYVKAILKREETDEEYAFRIKQEHENVRRNIEYKKRQLEQLKKELGES